MPPDMLKPAANQAFGSKSSFWTKKTEVIFGRRPLFLTIPPPNWRQITSCRKRRFQHIWQQITETPSEYSGASRSSSVCIDFAKRSAAMYVSWMPLVSGVGWSSCDACDKTNVRPLSSRSPRSCACRSNRMTKSAAGSDPCQSGWHTSLQEQGLPWTSALLQSPCCVKASSPRSIQKVFCVESVGIGDEATKDVMVCFVEVFCGW